MTRVYVAACMFLAFFSSCASSANPMTDRVPGIILTRRDTMGGVIAFFIDGKSSGKLAPQSRWGLRMNNGRYTLSFEYKGMRSRQIEFFIEGNRIEFDVWAYINAEPVIHRRR